jgi:Zn-finger nucleic acid-binding protein
MNCVNCGGGLRPVSNRNYFRCPYCETFHFPEETGDGVAVLGDATPYDCPVCAEPLTLGAIDGHTVCYCATCRGFLAENPTFSKAVANRRLRDGVQPHTPLPFAPEELRRRIDCPRCGGRMDTHPYHAGGNAVIDTCSRCRLVWLDAGELAVLGRYPAREQPPPVYIPPAQLVDPAVEANPPTLLDILGFWVGPRS